ncbi:MAG TPA: hypoxanthine phosphoribosyltransferase [Cyclobacteriaceae bacterium]|nr:hypoxanthine phosphoribosyltransferase [Cyclobacteriaceae bacterium]
MKVKDLTFKKFIPSEKIEKKVAALGQQINKDYEGKTPIFIPVLNGSFMFASDLMKAVTIPCHISFVKISSYAGTASTGQLKTLIGHEESLFDLHIIVVEDIVDSGLTLHKLMEDLRSRGAKSVEAIALLRKRVAREKGIEVKYVGFEIDDEFVLGYGLDYDGLGRNLKDIYKQTEAK